MMVTVATFWIVEKSNYTTSRRNVYKSYVSPAPSDWVSVDELLPVTWIGLSPGLDWHVDWIARHVFAEWLGQCRRTSTVVWVHSSSERVKRSRICTQQRRHYQHISCRSVHHHHQQHHHHHHHHHHNHQSIIIIIMIYVKYRQSDICCFRAMILPLLTVTLKLASFYCAMLCIARTIPWQRVCPSVCLSATRRYYILSQRLTYT